MSGVDQHLSNEQFTPLLSYYRSKIAEFDKERMEWLAKMEELRIQYEDKHRLDWELIKRKDEIAELQRSLTEAKCMLYEERQQSLQLRRENDMLKIKEMEDRKKIQELLAMTDAYDEQIVLQKDVRPDVSVKYQNKENKQNSNFAISKQHNVVKTIYLPNEQLNTVALENQNLKNQIEQAHILIAQQFAALKEEVKIISEEARLKKEADSTQIKQLSEKIQNLEKLNISTNKDNFTLRQRISEKERQLQEENEIIRQKAQELTTQLAQVQKKQQSENKATIELLEKKTEEYTKRFKNQVKVKDENLTILKEQYGQIQQIYIQKISQLEENLSKLVEKYQGLEKRRVLEIEGFRTDIKKLNSKVRDYEKNMQTQKLKSQSNEELARYQNEAQQLKEEALKQTQNTYQEPKKTMKKKKKITPQQQKSETMKQQKQQGESSEKKQKSLRNIDEQDDEEASMPIQELEYIQRQLDELEKQMDNAKKH